MLICGNTYDTDDRQDLACGAVARLRRKEGRTLKAGGLWVYDNEIDSIEGTYENGDILAVEDLQLLS